MTLNDYFEEMESLAFQTQFSVLSGLGSVEFALARDSTVSGLLKLLKNDSRLVQELHYRIRYLLPKVATETQLSYDESIVAYLYCLKKDYPLWAYRASESIWDTDGLLWSRWLAYKIIEFQRQIDSSLNLTSVEESVYPIHDIAAYPTPRISFPGISQEIA